MKRLPIIATVLTLSGGLLLAPAASADPSFTVEASRSNVNEGWIDMGAVVSLTMSDCLTLDGQPGYVGQFLTMVGPDGTVQSQFETITDETGTFVYETEITELAHPMAFEASYYCSSAPITDPADAAILWLSPPYQVTIDPSTPHAPAARQAKSSTSALSSKGAASVRLATKASTSRGATNVVQGDGPSVTMNVDPDALPVIDKIDITGPHAAKLKERVDANADAGKALERLVNFLLRRPTAPRVSNTDYVAAATRVLGSKGLSKAEVRGFVQRLDEGELRVRIVEDIALSQKPAAHWNRGGR